MLQHHGSGHEKLHSCPGGGDETAGMPRHNPAAITEIANAWRRYPEFANAWKFGASMMIPFALIENLASVSCCFVCLVGSA
jgi:hypothetical protein